MMFDECYLFTSIPQTIRTLWITPQQNPPTKKNMELVYCMALSETFYDILFMAVPMSVAYETDSIVKFVTYTSTA